MLKPLKNFKFLISFLVLSFITTGCNQSKIKVDGLTDRSPATVGAMSVSGVNVVSNQLVITGSNLSTVTSVKVTGPSSFDEDFAIESKSDSQIIANSLSNLTMLINGLFSLTISNAEGAAIYNISFEIQDGQVTAAKLSNMGATAGEVLTFDGTNWGPAPLSGLSYQGTFDATGGDQTSTAVAAGHYYIVTNAGTNDPDGGSDGNTYAINDWAVYNGTTNQWDKVVGSNSVVSVAGKTGVVALDWSDFSRAGSQLGDIANVDLTGRADGDILVWNNISGNWEVGQRTTDTNTNAITQCAAGEVLLGDGTCSAYVGDTNAATQCAAGEYLDGDGSCNPIPVDTNTTYTAGSGLNLTGTVFSIPAQSITNTMINGIAVNCGAGEFLEADGSGGFTCVAAPGGSTYSAGTGLGLTGTTFNVDVGTGSNQIVQLDGSSRLPAVDGSQLTNVAAGSVAVEDIVSSASNYFGYQPNGAACTNGQILEWNGAQGWVCGAKTTDTNTTYTAGTALGLTGTTFNVDVGIGANQVVQLDGSSRLPAVDGSQLTNVAASSIAVENITSSVSNYFGYEPNGVACSNAQVLEWNGAQGWVCGTKTVDTDTTLAGSAAGGSLTGTYPNPTIANQAVTNTMISGVASNCASGEVLKADGSGGFTCAADAGAGGGDAASLRGETIDASLATNTTTDGQILVWSQTNSRWEVGPAPTDNDTTYSAGTAIGLTGTTFNVDVGTGANQVVQLDGSSRLPAVDGSQLTNVAASSVAVQNITSSASNYFGYQPNGAACTNGQVLQWNGAQGWVCGNKTTDTNTTYTAGNGIDSTAFTGNEIALDLTAGTALSLNGVSGALESAWLLSGANLSYSAGNVGIGDSTPSSPLTISSVTGSGQNQITLEDQTNAKFLSIGTNPNRYKITTTHDRLSFDVQGGETFNILPDGSVGIGTIGPDTSALLELDSTTKGFLPPRMTTVQRNAIATPADGLIVFDTDEEDLYIYSNASWNKVAESQTHEFEAYGVSGLSIPVDTSTFVPFSTELYDPSNAFNPATGIYTVPSDGVYLFSSTLFPTNATGNSINSLIQLYVNGAIVANTQRFGGNDNGRMSLSRVIKLNSGDTVRVAVYQNTGSTVVATSAARQDWNFSGSKINGGSSGAGGGSDNLGNHILTQALNIGTNFISGDGDAEGLRIDANNGALMLRETGTATTQTANFGKLYVKSSDSKLYFMDDAGVEHDILGGALGPSTVGSGEITDNSITVADLSFASSEGIDIPQLASDPGSPTAGQVYYNTSTNKLRIYNGTAWVDAGGGGNPAYGANIGAGLNSLYIDASGNLGVGTMSPASVVDIAGGIKLANDTDACSSAKAGTLRYLDNTLEICHQDIDENYNWRAITSVGGVETQVDVLEPFLNSWPSAILCETATDKMIFYANFTSNFTNGNGFREYRHQQTNNLIQFEPDGQFAENNINGTNCEDKNLSQLQATGQTFDFESGSAGNMITGWPDLIRCSQATTDRYFYLAYQNATTTRFREFQGGGILDFDTTTKTLGTRSWASECDGLTIAGIYGINQAYDLVGGNGSFAIRSNFPDAILCTDQDGVQFHLFHSYTDNNSKFIRYQTAYSTNWYYTDFDMETGFQISGQQNLGGFGGTSDCVGKSLTEIVANGRGFYYADNTATAASTFTEQTTIPASGTGNSLVQDWPDLYVCTDGANKYVLRYSTAFTNERVRYRASNNNQYMDFERDGSFVVQHANLATTDCNGLSMSAIQSAGLTKNYKENIPETQIISGWPDVLKCGYSSDREWIYHYAYTDGTLVYYASWFNNYWIRYNTDGSFSSNSHATTCSSKSISEVTSDNETYNFYGGSDSGTVVNGLPDVISCRLTHNGMYRLYYLFIKHHNDVDPYYGSTTGDQLRFANSPPHNAVSGATDTDCGGKSLAHLTLEGKTAGLVNTNNFSNIPNGYSTTGGSMVQGWPDALLCRSGDGNPDIYIIATSTNDSVIYSRGGVSNPAAAENSLITFNRNRDFDSATVASECSNLSIPELVDLGLTFNFGGGSDVKPKFRDGTSSNDAVYMAGNVGIGANNPDDALDVVGDIDATGCFQNNNTGTIGGTCVSDERLKEDIIPLTGSLEKILGLRPVQYVWRPEFFDVHKKSGSEIGLIAQEVEEVMPEMVVERDDGFKRVKYDISLKLYIVNAIKEFFKLFEDDKKVQDRKIASLEEENEKIKEENKKIKEENAEMRAFLCTKFDDAPGCKK